MIDRFIKVLMYSLTFLLGSCLTVPPHKASDFSIPKKTRSGLRIEDHASDFSQVRWWEKMHDSVLNQLIREALANNNQIHAAFAHVLQAQAKLKEAQFAWFPTLSATGNGFIGRTWNTDVSPQGIGFANAALSQIKNLRFQGYLGGFVPKYSLNILENKYLNLGAKASLDKQKALYYATRLSIISQISGAYFMLLGQKEQLVEQAQLIQDLKKARHLEWVRAKDGASDLSTLMGLDQQITSNQAHLSSIENSISQVENAIALLLNRNPGSLLTQSKLKSLSVEGLIPENLPSAVLKNRPDLLVAAEELKSAAANIGLAYSNFFPTFPLTGLLGGASINLVHIVKLSTGLGLAQAAASMPLLNGAAYEQIKESKAAYEASYFSYLQTFKTVLTEVNNSLTNQQKVNLAYAYQLKSYKAAKRAYYLALARYKEGAKDYRETIQAQINLDTRALDLTLAKMQQLDSMVEVYQALAGGYRIT